MSKYVPSEECTVDFDGDVITFDVEAIEDTDFALLFPFYKQNENGETTIRFEDQAKFNEVSKKLIGKYVSNFSGLKDAKGNDVDLDTVLKKAFFLDLKTNMIGEVFRVGGLAGDDEKK